MSKFEHKPIFEEWFTARDIDGNEISDEYVAYREGYESYIEMLEQDDDNDDLIIYRASFAWKPYKRLHWGENGVEEHDLHRRASAKDIQGILGTDWLDGKTPEELVREHREGES